MQAKMIVQENFKEIDAKIKVLQAKKKKMVETRKVQLSNFLIQVLDISGANVLPQEILAGALLDAAEKFQNKNSNSNQKESQQQNELLKTWQEKGTELLSQLRGKKSKNTFRQFDKKDQHDSAKGS
jgi:hypothetical protein